MALQGHMFLFFPNRPIVCVDELGHSPHCAETINTLSYYIYVLHLALHCAFFLAFPQVLLSYTSEVVSHTLGILHLAWNIFTRDLHVDAFPL